MSLVITVAEMYRMCEHSPMFSALCRGAHDVAAHRRSAEITLWDLFCSLLETYGRDSSVASLENAIAIPALKQLNERALSLSGDSVDRVALFHYFYHSVCWDAAMMGVDPIPAHVMLFYLSRPDSIVYSYGRMLDWRFDQLRVSVISAAWPTDVERYTLLYYNIERLLKGWTGLFLVER